MADFERVARQTREDIVNAIELAFTLEGLKFVAGGVIYR